MKKTKLRNIMAIVLAVAMLLPYSTSLKALAAGVRSQEGIQADSSIISGDYRYIIENGCATIVHYFGKDKNPIIPSSIDGLTVKKIGNSSFSNKGLTSVSIPASVSEIGYAAFSNNSIRSANIPGSVKKIEDNAFFKNELREVSLPDSVTDLGYNAFAYNKISKLDLSSSLTKLKDSVFLSNELTSLVIPDQVSEIGESAFSANSIRSLSLAGSVKKIGTTAFYANDLREVKLPDSLVEIGPGAFSDNSISSLSLSNSVKKIGATAFENNELSEVSLPDSLTDLGIRAFAFNKISKLDIASSLVKIGDNAFSANILREVRFRGSKAYIGEGAFSDSSNFKNKGSKVIFDQDFTNTNKSPNFLPDDIKWYDSRGDVYELNTFEIPKGTYYNNLDNISGVEGDFLYRIVDDHVEIYGYRGGERVEVPAEIEGKPVKVIQENAFKGKNIRSVKLADSIELIEGHAFSDNQITEIYLPASLEEIKIDAFSNNDIKKIVFGPGKVLLGGSFDNNPISKGQGRVEFEQDFTLQEGSFDSIFATDKIWKDEKGRIVEQMVSPITKGTYTIESMDSLYSFRNTEESFSDQYLLDDEDKAFLRDSNNFRFIPYGFDKWNGSCFGMTALRYFFIKNGIDFEAEFGASNTDLRELGVPRKETQNGNPKIESTITLLHYLQDFPAFKKAKKENLHGDFNELVEETKEASPDKPIDLVTRIYSKDGGKTLHIVLVVGNQAIGNDKDTDYTRVLTILDPNYQSPMKLFISEDGSKWEYRYRNDQLEQSWQTESGFRPVHIIEGFYPILKDLVDGKYKEVGKQENNYTYLGDIDETYLEKLHISNGAGSFERIKPEDLQYRIAGDSSTPYMVLPSGQNHVLKTEDTSSPIEIFFVGDKTSLAIKADKFKEIRLNTDGSLDFEGDKSQLEASLIMDIDKTILKYPILTTSIKDVSKFKLSLDEENKGIKLDSDQLEGVKIRNTDTISDDQASFSTGEDQVLIKTQEKNELEVYIDKDKNGTFESKLDFNREEKPSNDRLTSLYGPNRYSTSVEICREVFDQSDRIILASGENFADALAASSLLAKENVPLLLTSKDIIPTEVILEIFSLGVKEVTIIGGENTISKNVENYLTFSNKKVDRIAGPDRYSTARLIAQRLENSQGKLDQAILADGRNFADALSISSYAGSQGVPILLVPENPSMEDIDKLSSYKSFLIVGGENSVSKDLEEKLAGKEIKRIAGGDRYETSSLIAKTLFPSAKKGVLASGETFPDALASSSLAKDIQGPILLTGKDQVSKDVKDLAGAFTDLYIIGGKNTISDKVRDSLN